MAPLKKDHIAFRIYRSNTRLQFPSDQPILFAVHFSPFKVHGRPAPTENVGESKGAPLEKIFRYW
ncbi:MAG TPA: hypothetical protein DCD96_05195 [Flavobacteriales bacterium]|nr:hypothetical protein [Flavobacteriales bacterium]